MPYSFLADLVIVFHLSFVLFVLLGGLLVSKWPRMAWLHLPAVAWGVFVEFRGWICPLTPLENWLRIKGGESADEGDFIPHYLIPILYPEGLTETIQVVLGLLVLAVNLGIYGWLWHARRELTIRR